MPSKTLELIIYKADERVTIKGQHKIYLIQGHWEYIITK